MSRLTTPSDKNITELLIKLDSSCVVDWNGTYMTLSCEEINCWLRKTYGINVSVDYYFDFDDTPHLVENCFEWCISWPQRQWDKICGYGYKDTYEDAFREGITEALKLIEVKKEDSK